MRHSLVLFSLATLLALTAAACGRDDGNPIASPSPATSAAIASKTASPSAEPSETPSPEPTEASTPELEDGRHFGYIGSIDTAGASMVFDLAYFLTGDEANEAARDHGDEVPVPNDYYLVNDNPRLRTLAISPDPEIWVIDWGGNCCDLVRGEFQPFVDAFGTKQHAWDAMYQGAESQYWVTVENGAVVAIEEQFLP